jgi:hypothetical protein
VQCREQCAHIPRLTQARLHPLHTTCWAKNKYRNLQPTALMWELSQRTPPNNSRESHVHSLPETTACRSLHVSRMERSLTAPGASVTAASSDTLAWTVTTAARHSQHNFLHGSSTASLCTPPHATRHARHKGKGPNGQRPNEDRNLGAVVGRTRRSHWVAPSAVI